MDDEKAHLISLFFNKAAAVPRQNPNLNQSMATDDAARIPEGTAPDELLEEVYGELRRLAQEMMSCEKPGQTLQATALVHEAYLRLNRGDLHFNDRAHFFVVATKAMRRILIDRARSHASIRGGGNRKRFSVSQADSANNEKMIDILSLDEALQRLALHDDRVAQVVTMRYFAGLSQEEVAEALGISLATVKRDWVFARAWLHRNLCEGFD